MGWFIDRSGDGKYDTEVKAWGNHIVTQSGNDIQEHQTINSRNPEAIENQIQAVATSLGEKNPKWTIGSSDQGAGLGIEVPILALEEGDPGLGATIEERGLGMGDISADEMLGKTEDEMLQWVIDTKYGGVLPIHISKNAIRSQIRTNLPQKGAMAGTDWYGIQETAGKVAGAGASVYGGMGGGARQEIAGQKQIGKDIYALEEGKGKEWTSKFRTFLSSLPSATGT
jgi:hypothetical protein